MDIYFHLSIYLDMELLGHMVTLRLTFWETAKLFSKVAVPFYNATSSVHGFQPPQIHSNTFFISLIIAILVNVKYYLPY